MTDQTKGLLLTFLGVMCIVPEALFVRVIDAPMLTLAFWKVTLVGMAIGAGLLLAQGTAPFRALSRAGWANGYGNLVQITHGSGMETRYGHMSKLLVSPNSYVKRGQIIGLMGSTGRSTGSHLHYEVRVDGAAINPIPFVSGPDYLVAMNTKPPVAMGGPTKAEEQAAD